jgi:hypothetical protein
LRPSAARRSLEAIAERVLRTDARWDVTAAAVYLLVSLWVYLNCPASWVAASDGHYSWVYARSLAYDHDLDFTNDYGLCGDPMGIGWSTPAHRPANLFYLGPAVFWTPAIWLLKHLVHGAPKIAGGCTGPIPALVLMMSSVAGAAVAWVCSSIARRIVRPKVAALGAILATVGGHLLYFTGMNPSYSHAYDAMCVALYLVVLLGVREGLDAAEPRAPKLRTLALAGLFLGLSILQRSSNCVFAALAVAALVRSPSWRELRRSAPGVAIVGAVAFFTGLLPILLANRAIYGRLTPFTHGPHFLHLAHAHPWLMIFDLRGGLFAWAPTLWLAVPGLVLLTRRKELRWLYVSVGLCGLLELYLSSAAIDWQGARRLCNLTPLGALGIALTMERVVEWLRARPARLANVAVVLFVAFVAWGSGSVCFGFAWGKLPWDTPLTTAQRFGEGEEQALQATEASVGVLPVLPATWLFAARYLRPPVAWGWAIHPVWYARDTYSLEYQRAEFSFTAPESRLLLRGFHVEDDHPSCMKGGWASAVFAAQWPFATRARLSYDASVEQELSVGSRSILGVATPWAKVALQAGKHRKVTVPIPPGGFDSGINEVELRTTGPSESLCFYGLELVDDARYPAAPEAQSSPVEHLWHAERFVEDGAEWPSVAVGSTAGETWVVEVHQAPRGQVHWMVGRAGWDLQVATPFGGQGYAPRIAAGDEPGVVVEVQQNQAGAGPLVCRPGRVTWAAGHPDVVWQPAAPCGSGYHPALAMGGAQLVEVLMNDPNSGSLFFRTGSYGTGGAGAPPTNATGGAGAPPNNETAAIVLGDRRALEGKGFEPSVAVGAPNADGSGRVVVEVHQKEAKAGPLAMRVGTLTREGEVRWGEAMEYGEGLAPSVALLGRTVVEVHQGKDDAAQLFVRTGAIGADGGMVWQGESKYDTGGRTTFAIDPRSGRAAEVHQGQAAAGSLWTHDGEVYRGVGGAP